MLTWEKLWKEQYNLIHNNCFKVAELKSTYDPRINKEVWLCVCNYTYNLLNADNLEEAKEEAIKIIKEIIPDVIEEKQKKREKKRKEIEELKTEITMAERNIEELKQVMEEL